MKKSNFIGKISLPLFFLIILLYFIFNNYDKLYIMINIFIFAISSFIWIWCYKYFIIVFLKFYIKMLKKNGKMPYSNISTMQFFEEHFEEITPNSKSDIKYSAILKVDTSENNDMYIYINSIAAYIIPFRAFKSLKEQEEFLCFIKEKII